MVGPSGSSKTNAATIPCPSTVPRLHHFKLVVTPTTGPALGHTGGDQAGAMTTVTKRTTTSSQTTISKAVEISMVTCSPPSFVAALQTSFL